MRNGKVVEPRDLGCYGILAANVFMRAIWLTMSAVLLSTMLAAGQTTKLRLSSVLPGSEKAQLVYNGDFEFKGPMQSNTWPLPDGWARQAEMFVGPGTN